ncbi:zinc ribbon domain-containing protein [Halomarina salina]|uniref:Zinc ribbon domain-containing protein n=1 Tax=Halomarina salina TaxID=1872699 RepID=A0ABD5RKV9_9EURY|nr:zinc ribbon domain-containing protein [Halomarina salina]
MNDRSTTGRPWLAVALSVAVSGLGHLYLRRWLRAVAWLGITAGATLVVPQAALDAAAAGEAFDVVALAPIFFVGALCALDAYLIAQYQQFRSRAEPTAGGELTHCPNCGGELEADLGFCHWCTTEFDEFRVARPAEGER